MDKTRFARHPILRQLGFFFHVHPQTSWTLSELTEEGDTARMRFTLTESDDVIIELLSADQVQMKFVFDTDGKLVSVLRQSEAQETILDDIHDDVIDAIQKRFFDFPARKLVDFT